MNNENRCDVYQPRRPVWQPEPLLAALVACCVVAVFVQPLVAQQDEVFKRVAFDQKLSEKLPLDLSFRNEAGQTVQLGDYFDSKPVILSLVYFNCPRLCTLELNGLTSTLRTLDPTAGDEFTVLTISFDPHDTPELATQKKAAYLQQYGREGAEQGWHFLTGDQPAIDRLCRAVGFQYMYDEQKQQFAHASGIIVLTPDGTMARYFYGIEYPARDVKLGLVEASQGQIGSPADKLLLLCYGYDPTTGKYGFLIMNSIRVAGLVTVLVLSSFVAVMLYRERQRNEGSEQLSPSSN